MFGSFSGIETVETIRSPTFIDTESKSLPTDRSDRDSPKSKRLQRKYVVVTLERPGYCKFGNFCQGFIFVKPCIYAKFCENKILAISRLMIKVNNALVAIF